MPINTLTPLKENILPTNTTIPIGSTLVDPYKEQGVIATPATKRPNFLPPPPSEEDKLPTMVTSEELYGARRYSMYDPAKTEDDYRWGQSGWDRAAHVADNFVEKTGAYLTQAVGFIGGAATGLAAGTVNVADQLTGGTGKVFNNGNAISYMTDNFLVKLGDVWKENVQERSPIYKSNQYTNGSIWQKLGTADWWQDDAIDRLALTASMIIPGFAEARGIGLFGAMIDAETGALRATGLAAKGMQALAENPGMYSKLGKGLGNQIYKTFAEGVADVGATNAVMSRALAFKNAIQTAQKAELYSWNVIGQSALNGREAQVAIRKELNEQKKKGLNNLTDEEIEDKAALGAALGFAATTPLALAGSLYELPQIFSTAKMGESLLKKFFNKETGQMLEGALESTVRPSLGKLARKTIATGLEHGQNESAQVALGRYLEEAIAGKTVKSKTGEEHVEIDDRNPFVAIFKNWVDNVNDPNGQNNIALGTIQGMLMTGFGHVKSSISKKDGYASQDARNRQFINSMNQGLAARRFITTPEDFYETKDGAVVLNDKNLPKFDPQKLAQTGLSIADLVFSYNERLNAIKNNDRQKLDELNFNSLSALAKNFFDDPKGMEYFTNFLRFEAKNQKENPDRQNDIRNGEEITPDVQLEDNLLHVKNLKKAYDAIENRHAGFTTLDIDKNNPAEVKQASEYIEVMKQAQYKNASDQIYLNNAILKNKIELAYLGVTEQVDNENPIAEQANELIKQTKELEDRLQDKKDDYKNLVDKKQFKEDGFQAWKEFGIVNSQRAKIIKESAGKTETVATVQTKKGNVDLNIGQEYSLTDPILNEDGNITLSPKITILSKSPTGELEVQLPTGDVQFMTPDEFKKYDISDQNNTSDEISNILDTSIDNVLAGDDYANVRKEIKDNNITTVSDKLNFINNTENQELKNAIEKEFNAQAEQLIKDREAQRLAQEELKRNKQAIDDQQKKLELTSGGISTGEIDATEIHSEGFLPDASIVFDASTTESEKLADPRNSEPHIKRARIFLNDAKRFKDKNGKPIRDNLRSFIITANQQEACGLSGLAQLSAGYATDTPLEEISNIASVDDGVILQVFVEKTPEGYFYINEKGERVGKMGDKVDVNKIVFQTMRSTDTHYDALDKASGKVIRVPRYRQDQKAKFMELLPKWRAKREELLKASPKELKVYKFKISRGITKTSNPVMNHVEEFMVPKEIISTQLGLVSVCTDGNIQHQGDNLKRDKGKTLLSFGDTLCYLNNAKLTKNMATTIYQVIKAFANDITAQNEKNKASGKKGITLNANYVRYLQNILFYSVKGTGKNKIYINTDKMTISLGNINYDISDIDNQESVIISQLVDGNIYHNINKDTLKDDDFSRPFPGYKYENSELTPVEWTNYQTYLLSATNPDGTARSVSETPLTVYIDKPTEALPYSFEQKYSILQDFGIPNVKMKSEEKQESKPPPSAASEFKYKFGGKENEFPTEMGNIKYTVEDLFDDGETIAAELVNSKENNAIIKNLTYNEDDSLKPLYTTAKNALTNANISFTDIPENIVKLYIESAISSKIKNAEAKKREEAKKSAPDETKPKGKKREDLDFRRVGRDEFATDRITKAEREFFKEYIKKTASKIPYEVLDRLIEINNTEKAWGVFENGIIKFFKHAIRGTEYHELGEAIWNAFLTPEEQKAIIDDEKEKNKDNTFKDRQTGKVYDYAIAPDKVLKERIMDDFAEYRLGKLPAKSLGERILRFFKSIIDFFNEFASKPSKKEELFKAIDKGKYKNYVVSKEAKQRAAEYSRIPDVTETQAFEYVQDMTVLATRTLFGENNENLFNIQNVTGKQVYDDVKQYYIDHGAYDELGENAEYKFNKLFERTKELLSTLGINFNEEDIVDPNDANTNQVAYAPEAFTTDWKKVSPFVVKILAATLPSVNKNAEYINSSAKLPPLAKSSVGGFLLNNFSRVFATTLSKLSNTTNPDRMADKLFELAQTDANYMRLYTRIGGDRSATTEEGNPKGAFSFDTFNKYDWRLFINFYQTFSKQKPNSVIQYVSGNKVYTSPADQFTATKNKMSNWFNVMRALSKKEDSIITYDRSDKVYKVRELGEKEFPVTNPQEMVDFLKEIGIDFPMEDYLKLSDKPKGKAKSERDQFAEAVSAIRKNIINTKSIGTLSGELLGGINSRILALADMNVRVTNPNQDNTHISADGKRKQSYTENNAFSILENEFNDSENITKLKEVRLELNDPYSEHSIILMQGGLFFDIKGNRIKDLKVENVEGIVNDDTGKSISIEKLSKGDRLSLGINQNLKGKYYILIPGDSATEWIMNLGNHISFDDIESNNFNKVYKTFRGYLLDDITLALDYKNREYLKHVGSKAKELRFFKDILSEYDANGNLVPTDVLTHINELIAKDSTKDVIIDYIDSDEVKKKINELVKTLVEEKTKSVRKTLEKSRQILEKSDGMFNCPMLDSDFVSSRDINKIDKNNLSEDQLNHILTFANVNYIIANIEFHKILFGDPYQFKTEDGKLDETKRIKSFGSGRRVAFNHPELNSQYNIENNIVGGIQLTPNDPGYYSFDSFLKSVTLKDVRRSSNLYKKIVEADASGFIMDGAYRETKIKNGQWTDEAEAFHQWHMAYTRQNMPEYKYSDDARGKALSKHDADLLKTPEPKYVLEILKPTVTGVKNGKTTIELVHDKLSMMPIYYKMAQDRSFAKFYRQTFNQKIGYSVFESGRKEGVVGVHSLYNDNGSFNESPFAENTIVEVPWKINGIQVENSYSKPKDVTLIGQMTKVSSIDMFDRGQPITPEAEKQFKRHNTALNGLHEHAYTMLLDSLGIENLGASGFELTDNKLLSQTLMNELLRRQLSENIKDTLKVDKTTGKFLIPFEASPAYKKIQDIVYSMINKSLVSPKMSGGAYVEAPVTLWEPGAEGRKIAIKEKAADGKFTYREISRKEYDGLSDDLKKDVVLTSDTLKSYEDEDGKRYCEIMIPHWFRDTFNKKDFPTDKSILDYLNGTGKYSNLSEERKKENQEILKGVGARIPVQAMSSMEVFVVKEFLPQFMGYSVVVPSDITAKTGSDFDVDKLNIYLKSVYLDENSDVRIVKLKDSEQATKDYYADVFANVVSNNLDKLTKYDDYRQTLLDAFKDIEALDKIDADSVQQYFYDKGESEFYHSSFYILQSIFNEAAEKEINPSTYLQEQIKNNQAKTDKEFLKLLDDQLKTDYVNSMYKKALENEYYDALDKLLSLPENFKRLTSPITDEDFKKDAAKLDKLKGISDANIKNRILDMDYMTNLRDSLLSGKSWVGRFAISITGHSLYQKANVYLDPERVKRISKAEQKILGNLKIVLPHNTTPEGYISLAGVKTAPKSGKEQYISERLSQYGTGSMDVANDNYLMHIIPSELAVSTFVFLERAGCGDSVKNFMNQPIIVEYLAHVDASKYKSLYKKQDIEVIKNRFPTTKQELYNVTIDVNKLEDNISNYAKGKLSSEDNAVQQEILKEFLKYAKMADYNFKITTSTNFDTTKFRNGDAFSRKKTKNNIAEETNIFSSAADILSSTSIGKQKEFIDLAMASMGAIFKLERPEFRDIISDVINQYERNEYLSDDDFDTIAAKIKCSFLDYIIQTQSGLNNQLQLLTLDDDSVANQLILAKEKYPNVQILKDLQVKNSNREGGAKTVGLDVNLKEAYDENVYTDMMRELKELDPSLYDNLIKLSIIQGSYQSAISIKNIIPPEDYASHITEIINKLTASDDVKNFANGSFQKNNFKDNQIMPEFIPKFRYRMQDGLEVPPDIMPFTEEEIYNFEVKNTFPATKFGAPSERRVLLIDAEDPFNAKNDYIKVKRIVTLYTGEKVDFLKGRTVPDSVYNKKRASGDMSIYDVFGYEKVKLDDGTPIRTKNGEYVFRQINLLGDGQYASEYYTADNKQSIYNNGTVKVDEISKDDLISFYDDVMYEDLEAARDGLLDVLLDEKTNLVRRTQEAPVAVPTQTETDKKKSNELIVKYPKKTSTEKDTESTMLQKTEGPNPSEASPKTIAMLKDFIKRIGVNIKGVDEIIVKGVKQDANGTAMLMQQLIQVVQGKEAEALPEEAMHFAVAIIKQTNPDLYKKLMSEINSYRALNEVFETYGDDPSYQTKDGKRDVVKLKEEAIAKVLTEIIIGKVEGSTDNPALVEKVNSWWDRIIQWLKGLIGKSGFDQASMDIISGKNIGTAKDIKEQQDTVFLQKSEQERIWDTVSNVSDKIEKREQEGYFINNAKVKTRVSDIVSDWYERRFKNNDLLDDEFDKAVKDLKAEKGTHGHAAFEYAFSKLVDENGYIREIALDEDDYDHHCPNFNFSMYEVLRDNLKERLLSFPKDTRFKSEITIYDANRNIAGTIDFLAVEKIGKVHILDWKFMDINVEKYINEGNIPDVPWYKVAAWKIQMDQYKYILQSAYGISPKSFGQSRMIPIRAKYTKQDKEKNIMPQLEEVIIGAVNPKDITDDYLLPVGIETERVQNEKINKLLERLNAEYSRLSEKSVAPSEKQEKAEQLNELFSAIRHLQMQGDLKPLLNQAKLLNQGIQKTINKYEETFKGKDADSFSEEQRDAMVTEIQMFQSAIKIYTSLYSDLKTLFGEDLSKEDKKLKKDLRKTSENAKELEETLNTVLEEFTEEHIAKSENVLDYLKPEKIIKGVTKLFSTTSLLQLKALQVMYKKVNRALGFATIDTTTESENLAELRTRYIAWARSKGITIKDHFNIIKKKDKNELIDKVSPDFYKLMKDKISNKDFDWIRSNINVAEYNKDLKEKKNIEIQRALDKNEIYTPVELAAIDEFKKDGRIRKNFPFKLRNEINRINQLYDTSTEDSVGWLIYDIIKEHPKELWQTKEWKELTKPGNEVAKEFYDYIIQRNNEYRDLGYISNYDARVFLPFIRKGLIEKLITGGNVRLGEEFFRNISIDQGDIGYGHYDKITGELVNTIPKYFTREIEGELSTDLFRTMSLYNEAAIKYKYIKQIESQITALVNVERNKKAISTSMFGKTEYVKGQLQYNPDNSANAKLVEDMMKSIIYGQKYIASETFDQLLRKVGDWGPKLNKKLGIDIFPENLSERQLSVNKILTQLNSTFQLNTLGLNLLSSTSNFLGGNFQSMINAGIYFTKTDYISSELSVVMNRLNGTDRKKMIAALHYFLPLTENYNRELSKHLSVNNMTAESLQDGLMYFMRKSDWNVQTANFYAYLKNSIVEDGEIVNVREYLRNTDKYRNIYEGTPSERRALENEFENDAKALVDEKGVLKLSEIVNNKFVIPGIDQKSESVIELRRKVQNINKDALGNLTEDDLRTINMNIYGKSVMVFHNWIPRLMDVRFGNIKYNSASDAYEWGRVRMIYRVLSTNLFKGLGRLYDSLVANEKGVDYMRELFEQKKADYENDTGGKTLNMTEAEFMDLVRRNIRNEILDVILLASMYGMFIALKANEPGKDEDPAVISQYRFMLKAVDKFKDELSYFYDPVSLSGLVSMGFPVMSFIKNFMKAIENFGIENFAIVTGNEKLEKSNMVIKYWMKTFLFTNQMAGYLPMFYPELAKELGLKIQSNYGIR